MSATKSKDIITKLCESYDGVKLTPDQLKINKGSITAHVDAAYKGVGNLVTLFITLSIPSVGFKAKKDKVKIDKVTTDIRFMISDCIIDKDADTCEWMGDKSYQIIEDDDEFYIKVYHKGVELEMEKNTNTSDPWWLLELPPMIDKACSDKAHKHLCAVIKKNSTDMDIKASIESLLAQWSELSKS